MLLENKVAVVYGAGGAIGGAVARAFAHEGARVFLSGRRLAPVEAVAQRIVSAGGLAEAAQVDALDDDAVARYTADLADRAGRIDIVLNAVGSDVVQGAPVVDLGREDFTFPFASWTTSQFLTSRAAARHMTAQRSGVILLLSASPARLAVGLTGGFSVACAANEALSRLLAAELAPYNVRAVCLRSHRIDETLTEADFDMEKDAFRGVVENMTLLKRLPTLEEVASTAAFVASDKAAAMTGAVVNLSCGMSVD